MNDDLRLVYHWVKGSREQVFAWGETLPPEMYTREHPDFAYGSIRNIHAHVAECYLAWVGSRGLGLAREQQEFNLENLADVSAMRAAFQRVDALLETAFERFGDVDAPVDVPFREHGALRVTRRWLVMHPITHEFHHKGQMLALGRVLGHPCPPGVDMDLTLPF